jgi:hypothetical protein
VGADGRECIRLEDQVQYLTDVITAIGDLSRVIDSAKIDFAGVAAVMDQVLELDRQIANLSHVINSANGFYRAIQQVCACDFSGVATVKDDLVVYESDYQRLKILLGDIMDLQSAVESRRQNVAKNQQQLDEAMGGVCPVCGSEMKGNHETIGECGRRA